VNRIRKCISCGSLKKRSELIKITKDKTSGNVILMPDSKTFGRSVYLCYNQSCIDNAFKKNRINKTLKTGADINKSDVYDLLTQDLKGTTDEQFKS
jgi:predicted RNA-binding protein YlxR (DUF448 family)